VLRLATGFDAPRLEAAGARALTLGTVSDKNIAAILQKGLDQRPLPEPAPSTLPLEHANLRGSEYDH
jgi:hypothetical protein